MAVCSGVHAAEVVSCLQTISEQRLPECGQNPEWMLRYAVWLNGQGRYQEAADRIERLLMQHPGAAQAVELYLQALAGLDRQNSAALAALQPMQEVDKAWHGNVGLQFRQGYSNNLNYGPVAISHILGGVRLDLASDQQPQPGFASEMRLSGQANRNRDAKAQWQLNGDLFVRQTDSIGFANYQGINLLAAHNYFGSATTETDVAIGGNVLRYGNGILLYAAQALLRQAWQWGGGCKLQAGADLLWQRQHDNEPLDTNYTGLMAGATCITDTALYNAAFSTGGNWSGGQRPGGHQWRSRLDAQAIFANNTFIDNSLIKARTSYSLVYDADIYDDVYFTGVVRNYRRLELGLEYEWPLTSLAKNLHGMASVNWQRQDSNISLFKIAALEGWLGMKIAW